MMKAYLVDDEPLARDELKYLLLRTKEVEIIGESDCMEDALADILVLNPDIVFLDIELEEESGLSIAKKLVEQNLTPFIIFATAYDEYALKAFDVNAVDYLLKPFDEARIQKTLEKIKKLQNRVTVKEQTTIKYPVSDRIAVQVDEKIVLLNYHEIVYLESNEGRCVVKTINQSYKVNESLILLEKKLDTAKFLRVHRSYIVNIEHIVEIEPWFNSTYTLHMNGGEKVPVSRTYVKEMKQVLGL